MRLRQGLLGIFLGASFLFVTAQEPDKLISGPGSTLTENKCKICHELQHIRRTPLSRGEWADNLRNMKERGTPMSDAEMQIILDYLSLYYSRDPAPAAAPDTLAAAGDDPVTKLLERHACSGCHALDKRVVGPSYQEIARRYAGDAGAAARLAVKVRAGGQGAWGPIPMPPAPAIAGPDLATVVEWVLGQR